MFTIVYGKIKLHKINEKVLVELYTLINILREYDLFKCINRFPKVLTF